MKDKPSEPKNKYAKPLKFNFSMFNEKPILKNGYLVALLVFIGLVVAFNIASSYDNSFGNQVTGLASSSSSSSSLGNSFGKITTLLSSLTEFVFNDLLKNTVFKIFGDYTDGIMRLLIFVILFTFISMMGLSKTITAIVSLVIAIFIPGSVITSIFGQSALLGGGLGIAIWGAVILLPLFGLFKWLKNTQNRFTSFALAIIFLGWLSVIGFVEEYTLNTLFAFYDLWGLLVAFATLACFVGFIWGVWKGFTKGAGKLLRGAGRSFDYKNMDDFIGQGGIRGDATRTWGNFKNLGKLWGGESSSGDKREALVKLDRLASMYYRKAIRGGAVSERSALENKFIQQAKKLGINREQAMRILWKR